MALPVCQQSPQWGQLLCLLPFPSLGTFSGVPEILNSLVTPLTPRVLPCCRIFLPQGLGLLFVVPAFPSARGWLGPGVDSCWWESVHGFKPLHLGWTGALTLCVALGHQKAKAQLALHTVLLSGTHGIVKKYMEIQIHCILPKFRVLRLTEQRPCHCSALTVLAESPSHNITPKLLFSPETFSPWLGSSLPSPHRAAAHGLTRGCSCEVPGFVELTA